MYVYDQGRRDVIASGVRVGGIDLGGLKVGPARQRLSSRLAASLQQPVTVSYHSRTFSLTGHQAHRSVDINALVRQALDRSRSGSIISRTFRGLSGGSVNVDIPLVYRYDTAAVRTFATRVQAKLDQPARDATVQPDPSGTLTQVPSRDGVRVDAKLLGAKVDYALGHPNATPRSSCLGMSSSRPSPARSSLFVIRPTSWSIVARSRCGSTGTSS